MDCIVDNIITILNVDYGKDTMVTQGNVLVRRQMLKYLGWRCHVSKFKCLRERSVKVMVEQIWQNVNN